MPSTIATSAELVRRLDAALGDVQRACERRPSLASLPEIRRQLERLRAALRESERPPRALRDELDFGQLASRDLDAVEPALARELFEIASWVAYA